MYGYNLKGDYENSLPERHLTTSVIDCTDMVEVSVKFRRWLGVEVSTYDHAYFRVSNNGTTWTTIWQNSAEVAETAWSLQEYDISSIADNQPTVYLRWTMGTTDGSWQYGGWNIDDVQIWARDTGIECTDSCDSIAADANCDDSLFCNGAETRDRALDCQAGSDPCPGENCDEVGDVCVPITCDNDGTCESGEDCNNCPNDCISGSGFCGDGICAGAAEGEDCFSCSTNCRCTGGSNCRRSCCGGGVCAGENVSNCPVDCDPGFVHQTPRAAAMVRVRAAKTRITAPSTVPAQRLRIATTASCVRITNALAVCARLFRTTHIARMTVYSATALSSAMRRRIAAQPATHVDRQRTATRPRIHVIRAFRRMALARRMRSAAPVPVNPTDAADSDCARFSSRLVF